MFFSFTLSIRLSTILLVCCRRKAFACFGFNNNLFKIKHSFIKSFFFIFSKSFLSMYFCHCFKKAVVCLCVLQKVHATDFFDF